MRTIKGFDDAIEKETSLTNLLWYSKFVGEYLWGPIINIINALILFGFLAFGILWFIRDFADVGQQYGETMV